MVKSPIALFTQAFPDEIIYEKLRAAGFEVLHGSLQSCNDLRHRIRILLVGLEQVEGKDLEQFPNLGLVALSSSGTDNIDLQTARKMQVVVTNVPNQATEEVATHAFALALSLIRNIPMYDRDMRKGAWQAGSTIVVSPRASSLTLGIIGVGQIGQELFRQASSVFGSIIGYDPHLADTVVLPEGMKMLHSLDELTQQADIVSLHVPHTSETERLLSGIDFSESRVRYLINVSRGGLIPNNRIFELLQSGSLYGAGLDVFEHEPPAVHDSLIHHPRVVSTPHRAYESLESREAYKMIPAENAIAFALGQPLITPIEGN